MHVDKKLYFTSAFSSSAESGPAQSMVCSCISCNSDSAVLDGDIFAA